MDKLAQLCWLLWLNEWLCLYDNIEKAELTKVHLVESLNLKWCLFSFMWTSTSNLGLSTILLECNNGILKCYILNDKNSVRNAEKLKLLKKKKPEQYALANKYYHFLKKRTKLNDDERYTFLFKY